MRKEIPGLKLKKQKVIGHQRAKSGGKHKSKFEET
jgi:hypothetical protein